MSRRLIFALTLVLALPARADQIADLIESSVVRGCEQINKPRTQACPAAPAPAPSVDRRKGDPCEVDPAAKALSPDQAARAFDFVSRQKSRYGLIGEFIADRVCAPRAQLVAGDLLENCRIRSEKVFVQPSRSKAALGLWRNQLRVEADGKAYRWDGFHVANVITVLKDGREQKYVLDPLLFRKPVPLQEWEGLVKQNDSGATSTVTGANVYLLDDDPQNPRTLAARAERDIAQARELARRRQR